MILADQYKKEVKDKEAAEEYSESHPQGSTVAKILQDENKSHLFFKLLERDGQVELGARILGKKIEADDIGVLNEYRSEFLEKIAQSEKIEALLTEENMIGIARNNPDFAKIINIITPKQAVKVIQSQLREMIITDENRFNAIAESIRIYESYKNGKYKKISAKVEKFCKDNDITTQEYLDALAIEDPDEKEEALKQLSSRTYGGFKKAVNIISGGKWAKDTTLQGLENAESLLEGSVTALDDYQKDIGSALFASVTNNDYMKNALSRELISENASAEAKEQKMEFSNIKKEATGVLNEFNEDEFAKEWENYKINAHYDEKPDYQDIIKDMFIDEQKNLYREKNVKSTGFWASIFSILFGNKIDSKRNALK